MWIVEQLEHFYKMFLTSPMTFIWVWMTYVEPDDSNNVKYVGLQIKNTKTLIMTLRYLVIYFSTSLVSLRKTQNVLLARIYIHRYVQGNMIY